MQRERCGEGQSWTPEREESVEGGKEGGREGEGGGGEKGRETMARIARGCEVVEVQEQITNKHVPRVPRGGGGCVQTLVNPKP